MKAELAGPVARRQRFDGDGSREMVFRDIRNEGRLVTRRSLVGDHTVARVSRGPNQTEVAVIRPHIDHEATSFGKLEQTPAQFEFVKAGEGHLPVAFVAFEEIHANAGSELQGGIAEELGAPFFRAKETIIKLYSQPKWGRAEEEWTLRHVPRNGW